MATRGLGRAEWSSPRISIVPIDDTFLKNIPPFCVNYTRKPKANLTYATVDNSVRSYRL